MEDKKDKVDSMTNDTLAERVIKYLNLAEKYEGLKKQGTYGGAGFRNPTHQRECEAHLNKRRNELRAAALQILNNNPKLFIES